MGVGRLRHNSTFPFLQIGQRAPRVTSMILAFHAWPFRQSHQAVFPLFGEKSFGRRSAFFSGCHWAAISGKVSASEPRFAAACWFFAPLACKLHFGQPRPLLLWLGAAIHSRPQLHRHQTFRLEPAETWLGINGKFSVGCHSTSSSGRDCSTVPLLLMAAWIVPALEFCRPHSGQPSPKLLFATLDK